MADSFSKDWQVVIHYPIVNGKTFDISASVASFLPNAFSKFALIVHNLDKEDDGSLKPVHMHIVGTGDKRIRKSTLLHRFSDGLGVPLQLVSVLPCLNLHHAVRYLRHLDDPGKYQYPQDSVFSNDGEWYASNLVRDVDDIDIRGLVGVIVASQGDMVKIAYAIGLKAFNTYNRSIWSLCQSLGFGKEKKDSK